MYAPKRQKTTIQTKTRTYKTTKADLGELAGQAICPLDIAQELAVGRVVSNKTSMRRILTGYIQKVNLNIVSRR